MLRSHYLGGPPPNLLHSEGSSGRAVLRVRSQLGDRSAARLYATLVGLIAPDIRDPTQLRLLMLAAEPSLSDPSALQQATTLVHDRIRDEARLLRGAQRRLLAQSEAEWLALTAQTTSRIKSVRWTLTRRFSSIARKLNARAVESISEINNTRAAYESQMQLQSAVQYWGEKRTAHHISRVSALKTLLWYSGVASLVALTAFVCGTIFMLEVSGVNVISGISIVPTGNRTISPSLSLIVAAAIASLMTGLFWAARLLVRMYVNERRFEGDAEERRVMTQTYLALIKTGAAQEGDRLVILNALFRPVSEVGHDDGPSEIAKPALIAKLLDQRR